VDLPATARELVEAEYQTAVAMCFRAVCSPVLTDQEWFCGRLASLFVVDMIDTALKGVDYFQSLGLEYPIRQGVLLLMALIAMKVTNRRYHVAFVVIPLVAEIWWIVSQFDVLS
jgi:hypothetical protein